MQLTSAVHLILGLHHVSREAQVAEGGYAHSATTSLVDHHCSW